MLVLVRAGTLGCALPLPIPPRGQDGGEVVRLSYIMRLRQKVGSWLNLVLVFGPFCLA
jgi:hypothetical protein